MDEVKGAVAASEAAELSALERMRSLYAEQYVDPQFAEQAKCGDSQG